MQAVIRKCGNSAALRLPVAALKEAALSLEQRGTRNVTRGRIVFEPVQAVAYDLNELLAGIDKRNVHGEFGFGAPVGKEALPQPWRWFMCGQKSRPCC